MVYVALIGGWLGLGLAAVVNDACSFMVLRQIKPTPRRVVRELSLNLKHLHQDCLMMTRRVPACRVLAVVLTAMVIVWQLVNWPLMEGSSRRV